MKNLIVGCGISGSVIAERIATEFKENVLIIDKKNHIGGNCFDYKDKNGITVHMYGSHIFHTDFENVWSYLQNFTAFNKYSHKVFASIDGIETNIPFNINSLYKVFQHDFAQKLEQKLLELFEYDKKISILDLMNRNDEDLKFIADYVYKNIFEGYTIKQWGLTPKEIDPSVVARVPVYISRDDRYFQDTYQGIPSSGYTKMIEKILNNPLIEMQLNTDFKAIRNNITYDRLFYTGSIDEFFDYEYGQLPYRSVNFKMEEYDNEYYQSNSVINYPSNHDFTRIHEYKYYLDEKSSKTIIAKEYSEPFVMNKNERFYPIVNQENKKMYEKYYDKNLSMDKVYFLGRLGDYKYYNIDQAINRALTLFESISEKRRPI